jgi:uncharacterized membrane protein
MTFDPVEYVTIGFPSDRLAEDIVPALTDLVDGGAVRILDLVFVSKDANGRVAWSEFDDLEESVAFEAIDGEAGGLLNEADIEDLAATLEPSSSALMIVWEDRWASAFGTAVRAAGGRLLDGGRIAPEAVLAAFASLEEDPGNREEARV